MTIKTLKYNYAASRIMKQVRTMRYTIYRSQKTTQDEREIIWVVSDINERLDFPRIIRKIRESIENEPGLKVENYLYPIGLGYARIMLINSTFMSDHKTHYVWQKI